MFEHGLLVSLPPREIPRADIPASVFDRNALDLKSISPELADAIALVESLGAHYGVRLQYVVRPEMFTHGESLAWLRARLGRANDHLALSDGSTIKQIPGLRNHAFFYGLARGPDWIALSRLAQRVPELFGSFATQINTALSMKQASTTFCPETVVLSAAKASDDVQSYLLRFILGPFGPEDGVRRILATGPVDAPPAPFQSVTYAPLTETGLDYPGFANTLAAALSKAMYDQSSAFVLALPSARSPEHKLEDRLLGVLKALQHADTLIPAASPRNLFISTGRLSAERVRRLAGRTSLLTHESFDFWRNSPDFYSSFRSIRVTADVERRANSSFVAVLSGLCGRSVEVVWTTARPERALV